MTELTQEVIDMFAEYGDDAVIPYFISTSNNHVKELNETMKELAKENVHIELLKVDDKTIKFNFKKVN